MPTFHRCLHLVGPFLLALLMSACQTVPRAPDAPATEPATPRPVQAPSASEPPPVPQPPVPVKPAKPAPVSWGLVVEGLTMPPLTGDALSRMKNERAKYTRAPQASAAMLQNGVYLLPDIIHAVHERGLPMEIAFVPAIESGFKARDPSSASADGPWQFMAATGIEEGLTINRFIDERRHLVKATHAAINYLGKLLQRFQGDLQKALAAYNGGQGRIANKVEEALQKGLGGSFSDLQLVDQTATYVPRLQALASVVADAFRGQLPMRLPVLPTEPQLASVPVTRDLDKQRAIRLSGLSPTVFEQLNPHLDAKVIPAAARSSVVVPRTHEGLLRRALAQAAEPLSSWRAESLAACYTVGQLANRLGVTRQHLLDHNSGMRGITLLAPGSWILFQHPKSGEPIPAAALNGGLVAAPSMVQVQITLARNQRLTWASAAKRLDVEARRLRKWNRGTTDLSGPLVTLWVPRELAVHRGEYSGAQCPGDAKAGEALLRRTPAQPARPPKAGPRASGQAARAKPS